MTKIWLSEENSEDKLDFFIPEKLEYFCFKSMQALNYLHSKNIYYGDMKPENLLIFKDYKVKLGDFGCSVKFSNDSNEDTLASIRGLT